MGAVFSLAWCMNHKKVFVFFGAGDSGASLAFSGTRNYTNTPNTLYLLMFPVGVVSGNLPADSIHEPSSHIHRGHISILISSPIRS